MKVGKRWEPTERYKCDRMCLRGDEENRAQRVEWRCSLLDFSEGEWLDDLQQGPYMGQPAEHRDGRLCEHRLELFEDHREGCPGGWYRCGFVYSLLPYHRPYSQGMFSENIRLSRTDDPLVIEAVQFYENELLRSQDEFFQATRED